MATRPSPPRRPVHYPSIPDADAKPGVHDEPPLRGSEDRVPASRMGQGAQGSTADLRLAIEQLLGRKESFDRKPWEALGEQARPLMVALLADEALRSRGALFQRLIVALTELGEARAVAPLGMILHDKSLAAATRAFAANALGRLGEPSAVELLAGCRSDKNDMIRRQVAMALGRMNSETVLPHLLVLALDKSAAVHEVAVDAVRRWEGQLGLKLSDGLRPPAPRKTPKRKLIPAPEH